MQSLVALMKMRLCSSSKGKFCMSSLVCRILMFLLHSYACSVDALKELTRLIPNFQKKIDKAEPDDTHEFYSIVSTNGLFLWYLFNIISSRIGRRTHVVMMFLS